MGIVRPSVYRRAKVLPPKFRHTSPAAIAEQMGHKDSIMTGTSYATLIGDLKGRVFGAKAAEAYGKQEAE